MGQRAERFARSVQEELGQILARGLKDPRVSEAGLLTITHVRVSDDLSIAWVKVALHAAEPDRATALIEGLTNASGYLSRGLGRRLSAKKIPELRFSLDATDTQADRVESLLKEIAAERKEKEAALKSNSDEEPETES